MASQPIPAVVDRFEGDLAVLRFADDQELVVATAYLPQGSVEGVTVYVEVRGDTAATSDSLSEARSLLNDLLQGTP